MVFEISTFHDLFLDLFEFSMTNVKQLFSKYLLRYFPILLNANLVPRGCDPFGQRRGSRPLASSNTGRPRFTDFLSLCACPESSLTIPGANLDAEMSAKSDWFWSQSMVFTNPFKTGMSLDLARAPDFQHMTKRTPRDKVD